MADELTPTPMVGEPSAAVSIAGEEKVVAQPPMLITASTPPSVAQPAAKPLAPPESVSKPAPKPEAKPQGKAPGKVSLTPAKVLQQKNGNHLSVQLMGSGSLAAIEQFVLANRLAGKVWIYQTKFHGSPWYVVLKGEHASMSQALAAIRKLSPALQKAGPWPKSFAQVKNELKQ
jgi:DamX protein